MRFVARPDRSQPRMPKEVRYLLFSTDEVLAALLTEAAEATPGAGLGAVSFSVQMATGLDGGVVLRIARRLPGGTRRPAPKMASAEVLGLLLRLCKRSRIPLPLRGEKRVELLGTCLALSVILNATPGDPRPVRGAMRHGDPDLAALERRVEGMYGRV